MSLAQSVTNVIRTFFLSCFYVAIFTRISNGCFEQPLLWQHPQDACHGEGTCAFYGGNEKTAICGVLGCGGDRVVEVQESRINGNEGIVLVLQKSRIMAFRVDAGAMIDEEGAVEGVDPVAEYVWDADLEGRKMVRWDESLLYIAVKGLSSWKEAFLVLSLEESEFVKIGGLVMTNHLMFLGSVLGNHDRLFGLSQEPPSYTRGKFHVFNIENDDPIEVSSFDVDGTVPLSLIELVPGFVLISTCRCLHASNGGYILLDVRDENNPVLLSQSKKWNFWNELKNPHWINDHWILWTDEKDGLVASNVENMLSVIDSDPGEEVETEFPLSILAEKAFSLSRISNVDDFWLVGMDGSIRLMKLSIDSLETELLYEYQIGSSDIHALATDSDEFIYFASSEGLHVLRTGKHQCDCNEQHAGNECEHRYCHGILSNESTVCNSRGLCTEVDQCDCQEDGYSGEMCELSVCFEKVESDTDVCNSRGECRKPNTCHCESNYYGDSCQWMIAQRPIAKIQSPQEILSWCDDLRISGTLSRGQSHGSLEYQWRAMVGDNLLLINDELQGQNSPFLHLSNLTLSTFTTYIFELIVVQNDHPSLPVNATVVKRKNNIPTLWIEGLEGIHIYRSSSLVIFARSSMKECIDSLNSLGNTVEYRWKQTLGPDVSLNWHRQHLEIPPFSFPSIGIYDFSLSVIYNGVFSVSRKVSVEVSLAPIKFFIQGGSRSHTLPNNLLLTSVLEDPEKDLNVPVLYHWSCIETSHPCPFDTTGDENLFVSAHRLRIEKSYHFLATVEIGNRTASDSVTIYTIPSGNLVYPNVYLSPRNVSMSTCDEIEFLGDFSSVSDVTFDNQFFSVGFRTSWDLYFENDTFIERIPSNHLVEKTKIIRGLSFGKYKIKFSVTSADQKHSSYAISRIDVSQQTGELFVTPSIGTQMKTKFSISALQKDTDSLFRFEYIDLSGNTETIQDFGFANSVIDWIVPIAGSIDIRMITLEPRTQRRECHTQAITVFPLTEDTESLVNSFWTQAVDEFHFSRLRSIALYDPVDCGLSDRSVCKQFYHSVLNRIHDYFQSRSIFRHAENFGLVAADTVSLIVSNHWNRELLNTTLSLLDSLACKDEFAVHNDRILHVINVCAQEVRSTENEWRILQSVSCLQQIFPKKKPYQLRFDTNNITYYSETSMEYELLGKEVDFRQFSIRISSSLGDLNHFVRPGLPMPTRRSFDFMSFSVVQYPFQLFPDIISNPSLNVTGFHRISKVISLQFYKDSQVLGVRSLRLPNQIRFKHLNEEDIKMKRTETMYTRITCRWWNGESWSGNGCWTQPAVNNSIDCFCNRNSMFSLFKETVYSPIPSKRHRWQPWFWLIVLLPCVCLWFLCLPFQISLFFCHRWIQDYRKKRFYQKIRSKEREDRYEYHLDKVSSVDTTVEKLSDLGDEWTIPKHSSSKEQQWQTQIDSLLQSMERHPLHEPAETLLNHHSKLELEYSSVGDDVSSSSSHPHAVDDESSFHG